MLADSYVRMLGFSVMNETSRATGADVAECLSLRRTAEFSTTRVSKQEEATQTFLKMVLEKPFIIFRSRERAEKQVTPNLSVTVRKLMQTA